MNFASQAKPSGLPLPKFLRGGGRQRRLCQRVDLLGVVAADRGWCASRNKLRTAPAPNRGAACLSAARSGASVDALRRSGRRARPVRIPQRGAGLLRARSPGGTCGRDRRRFRISRAALERMARGECGPSAPESHAYAMGIADQSRSHALAWDLPARICESAWCQLPSFVWVVRHGDLRHICASFSVPIATVF